jgi:anti-sigma B factor antagonist
MPSRCEVRVGTSGSAVVLTLTGEVDGSATDVLLPAYDEAVARAGDTGRTVVLDLSGVDYVNSTGIALIVSVLARARAQGRTMRACGLSDHYRQIFAITRLSDYIELYPDLGGALGSLPGGD